MSDIRDPDTDQRLPARTDRSVDVFRHLRRELTETSVHSVLAAELRKRAQHGRRKYGDSLHTHNGRDALRDAWEEAIDLMAYTMQMRLEGLDSPYPMAEAIAENLTAMRIARGDYDTPGAGA